MPELEAIIFDLDGTAMPSTEESLPNEVVASAVRKNINKIHLCAATGRSWPVAKRAVKKLGLINPCITSGGAVITDPISEEVIWNVKIRPNDINSIKELTSNFNYPAAFTNGVVTKYAKNVAEADLRAPLNTLYILNIPQDTAKDLEKALRTLSGVTVAKAYSWKLDNAVDLHITNREATKEHAVVELCNLLKVNRVNVAGVGDGFNDLHLFNSVGYKVAMGNVVDELKEAADIVIAPEEENGLAQFIESAVAINEYT